MTRLNGALLRRLAGEVAVVVFFLALAVNATWPLAADLRGQTLVGPDPISHMWMQHWLSGHVFDPGQLFHGNIFHPYRYAALHTDLSFGTTVLLLPLRAVVDDPVPLFNVATLLALAFGGWAFHRLVRSLTGELWAGLLAGVVAAFGSHQLSHVYHLNLLSTGWLALFLLGLHRLFERPSLGGAFFTAVCFTLTAMSSGYYAVSATLLGLLFAVWHWRRLDRRRLAAAAGAALGATLLMAPYLHGFLSLREETHLKRPPGLSVRMALHPERDLGSRAFVYRPLLSSGGEKMFPGLITLALAALALRRRAPQAGYYAAATVVLLVVSLGPYLAVGDLRVPLPYQVLFRMPLLGSMRHPYTFAAVGLFTLSVLAGLGWARWAGKARPWAGPLVVGLAVIETLGPRPSVRPIPTGLPPAYEHLLELPPGAIIQLPLSAYDSLLWAARHGLPVINGVGAFAPPQILRLNHRIQQLWLDRAPGNVDQDFPTELLLGRFPVRYVVLPGRQAVFERLAQAFERSRTYVLLKRFPDGSRLYEVRRRE